MVVKHGGGIEAVAMARADAAGASGALVGGGLRGPLELRARDGRDGGYLCV